MQVLNGQTRGEILALKTLPILKRLVDECNTSHGYAAYVGNDDAISGSLMREGRMRLLSIGSYAVYEMDLFLFFIYHSQVSLREIRSV
jgi:hypothetical protein